MIPERTKQTIDDYVNKFWEPGDFVRAVLENNLMEAFGRADIHNRAAMFEITCYVYNNVPHNCHGSREIVNAWMARRFEKNEESVEQLESK